ncbi:hypothetical protein CYPRO_1213 [Cyclonatronum proteinivorum]|uniref:Uncharacterized protein n=1 Tax=Cyclonatronum proteinivorum TaxID=1457365 RepID=A0A345UJ24_9BACT|nr:hypothetical protein [Cyclonatronum proteinivorum]AXJ00476.1 hypothetical protein CYPRO_1213 [Cyclonatronum proteinivorum]
MPHELKGDEGYVFTSFGKQSYLRDVIVAVDALRRFDTVRPVALYCSEEHANELQKLAFREWFTKIVILPQENQSIIGFKHQLYRFMPFTCNMYLDSDMIWCRNPDPVWYSMRPFGFTLTGNKSADIFFGAPKSFGISPHILFRRRQRTLRRFGLTHLYRVQTGLMFARDEQLTREVCEQATAFLHRMDETHFTSRTNEKKRSLESCEWSLGMAVSHLGLHLMPWFNGYESLQLDYIRYLTHHNADFTKVACKYYCNPFIYGLRGIKTLWVHKLLKSLFWALPRSNDHIWVTPYLLHFGWLHEKEVFEAYAERRWTQLTQGG